MPPKKVVKKKKPSLPVTDTTTTTTTETTELNYEKDSADDVLTVLVLFLMALSMSYLFIRYLLLKRQNLKKTTGENVRRHRFSRIRKNNFSYKPWLDPLESLDSFRQRPVNNSEDEDEDGISADDADANELFNSNEDADHLIQSNISREFVRNQLDPFALKQPKAILKNWDLGDVMGVALAAGCAILFIFILSNVEE